MEVRQMALTHFFYAEMLVSHKYKHGQRKRPNAPQGPCQSQGGYPPNRADSFNVKAQKRGGEKTPPHNRQAIDDYLTINDSL